MRLHRHSGLFSDPRNRGLWLAVGMSALLHVGLMAAFGRFHIRPVERTFYAPMHMIDLVEPRPRAGPKDRDAPASAPSRAPSPPQKKPEPTRKVEPAPKKTPVAAIRTVPAKPTLTPVPVEPTEVLEERLSQRIARMRQKTAPLTTRAETPAPARAGGGVDEAIERIRKRFDDAVPKGASGAIAARPSGNVMEQVRLRAYYNQVWEHVNDHWTIPPGVRGKDLSVIVSVRIDRQGRVLSVETEVPSKSDAFDRSALQALQRAEPLPTIPELIPDATLEIGFRFHGK